MTIPPLNSPTMSDWFTKLQKAPKDCIVEGNLKRVHYDLEDGKELVEEYDLTTKCLTRRAWRCNKELKGEESWDIEIGDPLPVYSLEDKCIIRENADQPFVTRRSTRINLEWRIRNLPYPISVYAVTVEGGCVVVRTNNKKYFKKLPVPELDRLGVELEQEAVSFSHKFNTLIITYKKPRKLLEFETAWFSEVSKLQPKKHENVNDCKPS